MQLLKQLYSINSYSGQEDEIKRFVMSRLATLNLLVDEDEFGNLFITKGQSDSYPCVAAHLDEVHQPQKRNIQEESGVIYAVDDDGVRVGIGADDKNGVWVIMRLLEDVDVIKAVLFVREEKATYEGYRHGSDDCNLSFFNDVKYVVQCDRKGAGDMVTYCTKKKIRLCDDNFVPEQITQKYGYSPVEGGVTDVVHLKQRGLEIPCCNVSCGYYNAHKSDEYCVVSELLNCLSFVLSIVRSV